MQALKSNESHLACPFFIIKMKNKMLYFSLFSTSKELEVLKRRQLKPLTSQKTTKKKTKPKQEEDKKKAIKILLLPHI